MSWNANCAAVFLGAAFAGSVGGAALACPDKAEVASRAAAYIANQPLAAYETDLSLADAYCAQSEFVARIVEHYGEVIGYKVAFTGKATQDRFQMPGPAMGVLLAGMIVADGSSIPLDFGFRPHIEPDMLMTIQDEAIMGAATELEAAAHIGEVRPFLELTALQLREDVELTGITLVAFNIAARAGVYGAGIPVEATPEFVRALADVETVFTDETGAVLQAAPGSRLLGNPLRAMLWLIAELKSRGETLEAGQVVSLGSLGRLFPLRQSGKTYTLTYKGLPGGDVSASVSIE